MMGHKAETLRLPGVTTSVHQTSAITNNKKKQIVKKSAAFRSNFQV